MIPAGPVRNRTKAGLAAVLLLSLGLPAPAAARPPEKGPSPESFDFSDLEYRRQGIDPARIRGRLSAPDGPAAVQRSPDPSHRDLRALEWRGAYDAAGCISFFHRFGMLDADAFLADPSGAQARRLADQFRVFTFPRRNSRSRRPLVEDRQDPVFDTSPGSPAQNPLGLRRLTKVSFTEKVFRSRPGMAALDEIRRRNGTDLDGTPILKNLSDIRNLEQEGFVALSQESSENAGSPPWVLWPLVRPWPSEGIPRDAFPAVTVMDDGGALDAMLELSFLNLARSGIPGMSRMPRPAPFAEPLPIPPILESRSVLDPPAEPPRSEGALEAPPVRFFELHERAFLHHFHPDLPPCLVWGYQAMLPGPTILVRRGEPFLLRVWNDLPEGRTGGIGQPRTVCQPALFPLGPRSAGDPLDPVPSGRYQDHYCSAMKGASEQEPAPVTGRYRDGRFGFGAQNTYRGLAGLMIARDPADSGDENDPSPRALRLPSGAFDVPLILADRQFDETLEHALAWDPFGMTACSGDFVTVNGVVQPFFKVSRRKYRFRLWNAGPSRVYRLSLSMGLPMAVIATDGYLLGAPAVSAELPLLADQHRDVIIDFAAAKLGTEVVLEDRAPAPPGRSRSIPGLPDPPTRILKFRVDRDAPDPSRLPSRLAPDPSRNVPPALAVRTFAFSDYRGIWTLNGRTLDLDRAEAEVPPGASEVWILRNESADQVQTIRLPVAARRLAPDQALPLRAWETGPQTVMELPPGREARLLLRTPAWPGRYRISSSDALREDQGMMFRWDVKP